MPILDAAVEFKNISEQQTNSARLQMSSYYGLRLLPGKELNVLIENLELTLLQQVNTLQTLRYLVDGGIDDRIGNIEPKLFKELILEPRLCHLLSGWCIDNSNFSIHALQEFAQDNDNLTDISSFSHFNCSEIKLGSKWGKQEIENARFVSDDLEANGLLVSIMNVYSSYFSIEQAILNTKIRYYQNASYSIVESIGDFKM
ncbi:22228_t:CDS:2 [Gigaspora rosea]|nr:22228_t:CDS:2 [Gigaspora rosea]